MDKKIVPDDQVEKISELIGSIISEHFRGVRSAAKITQSDLADRLGVSTQTVKSLEVGRTRWNTDNFVKVAAALMTDPAGILRLVASRIDDELPTVEEADPLLAQLVELYQRRDLPGLMRHLGELAVDWGMARKK